MEYLGESVSACMYVLYLFTIGDMLKDGIVCKPLPGEDGGLPVISSGRTANEYVL